MTALSIDDLTRRMGAVDFAMLSTHSDGGQIGARPMSNNGDVHHAGDSYYFTTDDTHMVHDIRRDPRVGLSFQGKTGLLHQRPFFIAVEGRADLVDDRDVFEDHWHRDLDYWFEDGVDTPGLVMIHVHAERAHYWDGDDEGELILDEAAIATTSAPPVDRGSYVGGP